MKSGYKPKRFLFWHVNDHRDYDFHASFGTVGVPEMPDEIRNDTSGWMPNQNAFEPIFKNPPMPEGCTNCTQNDVAANYAGQLFNPGYTESKTHANARGGIDIAESFDSVIKDGVQAKDSSIHFPFKAYYEVTKQGVLDWFDAFKVCMFLDRKHTISIGIPWFSSFEQVDENGVVRIPTSFNVSGVSWHNAEVTGYVKTNTKGQLIRNGEQFLQVKSWQGENFDDAGWCYFPRSLVNTLFEIRGTQSKVGSPIKVPGVKRVSLDWVGYIVSFLHLVANNYVLRPMGVI